MSLRSFLNSCKENQTILLAGAVGVLAAGLITQAPAHWHPTVSDATPKPVEQVARVDTEITRQIGELRDDVGRLTTRLKNAEEAIQESRDAAEKLEEEAAHRQEAGKRSGRQPKVASDETARRQALIKEQTAYIAQLEKTIREFDSMMSDPQKLQKRAAELQNALVHP